ncbi:MAG: Ig-like domain-containing protein [Vicinamibacterales bacterium]|nr:Ig-like domain-containing protein [Vicinamibacterales bacterium]
MSRHSGRLVTIGGFSCVALLLVGCGGGGSSPAAPSPAPAPAAPTVTAITVTGPGCVAGLAASGTTSIRTLCTAKDVRRGSTLQLAATAALSDSTTQTVTSQAQWTSSNQNVATVSSAGLVTILTTGESDVVAAYQGKSGGHTVRSAIKVPYVGTTSQGLPMLVEVGVHQLPSPKTGFRILGFKATIRYTFPSGHSEGTTTSTFDVDVAADGSFRRQSPWPFPDDYFEGALRPDGTLNGSFHQTHPPILGQASIVVATYTTRLSENWPAILDR